MDRDHPADGDRRDTVAEVAADGDRRDHHVAAEVAAEGVDRLSDLPDDILLEIVQRLVTDGDACAAARTCVLSREWSRLPRYEIRNVSLDVRSFFPEDGWRPVDPPRNQELFQARQRYATKRFTAALWSFLAAPHRKRVIDTLRLKMILTRVDMAFLVISFIGRAARTKRTKRVELEIRTEVESPTRNLAVKYGNQFSRLLECRPTAFAALARLSLENLWFRDTDAVNGLLRGCAALEHLSLRNCGYVPETELFVDAPPESRLQTLLLVKCRFLGVQLHRAPSLVEFHCSWRTMDYYDDNDEEEEYDAADEEEEYDAADEEEEGNLEEDDWWPADVVPASFGFTPLLKKLTLHYEQLDDEHVEWKLSKFLQLPPGQLQVLTLSFKATKIWVQPEDPKSVRDVLSGLKELYLEDVHPACDLSWVFFLLEAAPLLEILHIKIFNHVCVFKSYEEVLPAAEWKPTAGFRHEHLKALTIRRAFDVAEDLPFARKVMEMAANLEWVSLGVQDMDGWCEGCAAAMRMQPELEEARRADREDAAAIEQRLKDGIW